MTIRTPEIEAKILERIASGESLRAICRDEGMPDRVTFWRWLDQDPELRNRYARAREESADHYADEIVSIADDGNLDPHSRRVMIDARKWVASKLKPKSYGDKIELGGTLEHSVSWADRLRQLDGK